MHVDDRGVDHLDSGIADSMNCIYDVASDICPTPTDEWVVACGVRTKHLGQIMPRCVRTRDPEDAIEDTVVKPRSAPRLFGSTGLLAIHSGLANS
jgi:hypothetical protein